MNKLEHLYTEAFNNITQIVNFYFSTQEKPNNCIPKEVITNEKLIYDLIKTHFKQPTFEEVKKEWEEAGYEYYKGKNHIHFRVYDDDGSIIDEYIFHPTRLYYVANDTKVTFEMFQLISKTLKALEVQNV